MTYVYIVIVVAWLALVIVSERRKRGRRAAIAEEFGLVKNGSWEEGTLDGVAIAVAYVNGRSPLMILRVTPEPALPAGVSLGAEVWTKGADKPLKSGELVTGDADFDRLFRLKGPEAPSRAMLSAPARQLIKSMGLLSKLVTVMFVSVADGCIYHRANGVPPAPAKTRETFESLISLGRLMSFPEDGVADRLRQNMASESDAAVRQATADVLSRLDADSPA